MAASAAPWILFAAVGGSLAAPRAAAAAPVAPAPAAAAGDPLAVPRFESVARGLIPRGVVATLAQDRDGFLWLATGDGLARFDGYRLRMVERDVADPTRRNLGWIRALRAGRDGRLWIGTETDGLAVYDPRTDRVTDVHPAEPSALPPATHSTIRALAEDRDGAIWIGSLGGGLQRHDPSTGRLDTWRHAPQPGALPDDRVLALHVDRQGQLWVGSWAGLARRDAVTGRFEPVFSDRRSAGPVDDLGGQAVQAIHEDAQGRLWVGTARGAVALVDPQTRTGRWLAEPPGGARSPGAVTGFAELPGGVMWVGRSTGLDLHEAASGAPWRTLRHDPRNAAGLAADEITALLVDEGGAVWVAGLGLGLQRHDPAATALRVRGADLDDAPAGRTAAGAGAGSTDGDRGVVMPGWREPSARSVAVLDTGEVWLASAAGGLVVMDPQLRVRALVPLPPLGANAAPARVPGDSGNLRADAVVQAADGTVWVNTGHELRQFDRDRRLRRSVAHAGPAHRLFASRDGSVWVCAEDGLYRLRPGASMVERVRLASGAPLATDAFAIAETADGRLWVGTATGLHQVEPGRDVLQPVPSPTGTPKGLGNPVVIGVLVDRSGQLWVDTAVTGLHRMVDWDGREARFDRVSLRLGLAGRPFGANLLQDALGRIWTQQYVYDPSADRVDELTVADGRDIGTGWFHAYGRLADGRLLFAGSKGLLVADAERWAPSDDAPRVVVSELRVDGRRMPAPPALPGIGLTPEQRRWAVTFAALDYSDPAQLRYAVRLEGLDRDWLPVSADDRTVSYGRLSPGAYRLRVRATNRSGVWSPHELDIPVIVQPAWWQTPWAAGAAVGLAALATAGLVRSRTAQLRRRQRELEASVRQRTVELERLTEALRRESEALKEASLTDPLTGLRNRRFLTLQIAEDAALAVRRYEDALGTGSVDDAAGSARDGTIGDAPPIADADLLFVVVDLDGFKQINDARGHAVGDSVLRAAGERLAGVFRESDRLVRWGGEEFLAVARGTSREHAAALAERVRAAVAAEPVPIPGQAPVPMTASVGFCAFPLARRHPRGLDWSQAVDLADAALYAAKAAGRNAWVGLADAPGLDAAAWPADRPGADWLQDPRVEVRRSNAGGSTSDESESVR
ncbi:MAG: diguanylate cyclase [Ideonella sp.]|nr:diguanylate cyclase [Ideonella sp.]